MNFSIFERILDYMEEKDYKKLLSGMIDKNIEERIRRRMKVDKRIRFYYF